MPNANEVFRDFERFTGDGKPGAPTGAPLPIGDPRSGLHNLDKWELRQWGAGIEALNGNPDALNDRLQTIEGRATPSYTSRAAAEAAAADLPTSVTQILVREGTALVIRARNAFADDPLFPNGARWGVVQRQDGAAEATARQAAISDINPRTTPTYVSRAAAEAAAPDLPTGVTQILVQEDGLLTLRARTAAADDPLFPTGARWGVTGRFPNAATAYNRGNHTGSQAIGTIEGLTAGLSGKAPVTASWDFGGYFNGANITASHSGSSLWIGWAGMSVRRSNGLFWSIADRAPALLPLNGVLYVEATSNANPLAVLQSVADTAFSARVTAGEVVVLLQVGLNRLSGIMSPAVEQALAARINASLGPSAISSAIAQTVAMSESWDTGATVVSIGTTGWYACQPTVRDRVVSIANSAATVDLEYLPLGRTVTISAGSGCRVFAGDTSAFSGQSSMNHAVFSSEAVFRATRVGNTRVLLEPLSGGAPVYSSFTRPAMGRNTILAGQSQNAIGGTRGLIGGFVDEMMTAGVSGQIDNTSNYFVRSAVSGSSATKTATSNYWWDDQLNQPGPLLLAAVSAAQAAVSAGQPAPTWLIWRQGEADARSIETGALTGAAYKAAMRAIWLHFRGVWPGIRVIASPPGASDQPISKRGMASIRQAYLELTEEFTWANYGHEMYDVPRNYGNVHPTDDGYYVMGIRDALVMQLVDGTASPNLGPRVLSAVRNANGTITVEIGGAPSNGLSPAAPMDNGPSPYGFSLLVGDPATATAIPIAYGSCLETGAGAAAKQFVTLYPLAGTDGAYLHTVSSQAEHAFKRTYPMTQAQHGKVPGFPMRFQRILIT